MSVALKEMDDVLNVIARNIEVRYHEAEMTPGFLYRSDLDPWRKEMSEEGTNNTANLVAAILNFREKFSLPPEPHPTVFVAVIGFMIGYFRTYNSTPLVSPAGLLAHFIEEYSEATHKQLLDFTPEAREKVYDAILRRIEGDEGTIMIKGAHAAASWGWVLGTEFRKYVDDTDVIDKMGEQ